MAQLQWGSLKQCSLESGLGWVHVGSSKRLESSGCGRGNRKTAELVRMGWLHPLLTLFLPDSGTLDRPFPVSHCPKYQLSPEMPSQIHPEVRSTNFLHLILTISVLGTNIPK